MNQKYSRPTPLNISRREWPDRSIGQSPAWCAVDLRDGNQALPNPMTPPQKRRYFQLLLDIGFKEIEIGFPSASADDFKFCRDLIEENLIPEDVTISVLTQAREHLIRKTMEALRGAKRAVCHVYIATSDLHMNFVFNHNREQVLQTTLESVALIRDLAAEMTDSNIGLEFSPEEFTDSDLDFVVELCDKVIDTWQPKPGERVILNLPATVERRLPHEYADMIEQFCRRQRRRADSIVSLHAHNDMGTAVAATQMALMAGADRVEGTLFGHGERCGNVDLVTIALNLQYMGIDTGLSFANLEDIRDELEELTSMPVHPRHPYAGSLVFTAFAGSHQDAIHKGLSRRDELSRHFKGWKVPYLHIAPGDIGRSFEKFIRINSQSGKGGIAHVLESEHGIKLPRTLLVELSRHVQKFADSAARELESSEVWDIFRKNYVEIPGALKLINYWPRPNADDPTQIEGEVHLEYNGQKYVLKAAASGPIAAFTHAVKQLSLPEFSLTEYEEGAIGVSADAEAAAFVRLEFKDSKSRFGVGFASNIDQAAVRAIVSALNSLLTD